MASTQTSSRPTKRDFPRENEGSRRASVQSIVRRWMRPFLRRARGNPLSDFRLEIGDRRFPNPETGNEVLFDSLPKNEQARLFAEWRRRQRGQDPPSEKIRGLIKVDKQVARAKSKEVAGRVLRRLEDEPDVPLRSARVSWPLSVGPVSMNPVRGESREVGMSVTLKPTSADEWKIGRKYVLGGKAHAEHEGDTHGRFFAVSVSLNPEVTPSQLLRDRVRFEQEIYHVLIHELTHAQDRIPAPKQVGGEEDDADAHYYNKPHEVRAFKQQVVDEIEEELKRKHEDDDDPIWIGTHREAVEDLLLTSNTWMRIHRHLTPENRRNILQTVASVMRKFKEDRGGKVAASR